MNYGAAFTKWLDYVLAWTFGRQLFMALTPHSLCCGGALAALAVQVPIALITAWGGWQQGSTSIWKYVALSLLPLHFSHQLFDWIKALGSS